MFDDISFLVQETLKDAEKKKGFFTGFMSEKEVVPETPGVLFHLQKNASTFVVRIIPSKNLSADHKNIKKHPDLYPALRLDSESITQGELRFFECDTYGLAMSLRDNLANKRYPMDEENVFNVSDPGDSWWMTEESGRMTVYFKLSRTEYLHKLIKLGPIGDGKHYEEIFMKLRGYFEKLFPVADFSSGHGQVTMQTTTPDHPVYRAFVHLFKVGEVSPELFEVMRDWEMDPAAESYRDSVQKANFTMIELATLRGFWREIQSLLV